MGKRAHVPQSDVKNYVTSPLKKIRSNRKHKTPNNHNTGPSLRPAKLHSEPETDDDDEDSSSNDAHVHNCSTKQASSVLINSSLKIQGAENTSLATNESPRPVYSLRPSIVNGTILYDLKNKPWRLGSPIGKGNFGEIFLASDNITLPVTNENAKFVVKIEPHSNGPLFVEIHCILNTAKKQNISTVTSSYEVKLEDEASSKPLKGVPSGIPDYIASGSHFFGDARYRFLVLQRFDQDLHSLIKNSCVSQKSLLTLAIQIINVLENLHDKGYCHNDVKSQNLMISKCKYYKNVSSNSNTNAKQNNAPIKSEFEDNYDEKQPTTDSGNSSEQEANDDDDYQGDFISRRQHQYNQEIDDDEDFNDGTTTSNSNSNSMDIYKTPVIKNNKRRRTSRNTTVQYSGSNPVRSCRRQQRPNSIYEEMVNSHYLRPTKRINYAEFFADDVVSVKDEVDGDSRDTTGNSTEDDDSVGFVPSSLRRRVATSNNSTIKKSSNVQCSTETKTKSPCKRLTRRQEKLLLEKQQTQTQTPLSHFSSLAESASQLSTQHQNQNQQSQSPSVMAQVESDHIFLIDFGLASKYIDNGLHRPFVMDQRRAHDGTLEFTSRDAHMGAHSRRSDLECLGYNLIFWSQGFLPWKDAAAQQQQEKVHRAKEYLMTDVREMLKQIYGKDVPKCLGEFLHLVGQLAYHERPQYSRYRRIFEHEYQQLGYSLSNMCLDSQEIARTCVRIKKDHGAGKHDFFELNNKLVNNNVLSIMKSGGTPFQERGSLGDRVSPKNLRSKSSKKPSRKKKFSWTEVLSQDPDQIARERAQKEFDREINYVENRPVRRYQGKPTYAILELLNKYNERKSVKVEINDDEIEDAKNDEYTDDEEEDGEDEDDDKDSDASIHEEDEDEDCSIAEEEVTENEESGTESEEDTETETSQSSFASREKYRKRIGKSSLKNKGKSNRREAVVATVNSRNNRKSNLGSKRLDNDSKESTRKRKSVSVKDYSPLPKKSKTLSNNRRQNERSALGRQTSKKIPSKQTAASAAGEQNDDKHAVAQYLFEPNQNGNQKQRYQQQQQRDVSERPKRRCPIKTETTDNVLNGGNRRLMVAEDDSNSSFSPDVRILFNIWNKISNENLYAKSAAAAASKATTPASGGMVTRHYRK